MHEMVHWINIITQYDLCVQCRHRECVAKVVVLDRSNIPIIDKVFNNKFIEFTEHWTSLCDDNDDIDDNDLGIISSIFR